MWLFDRDTFMLSELAKKTMSAATHPGLMENWKTIQETIATPVTGVGLLRRGETIFLYLAILPCSRHPLFLLSSLSRFLLPTCLCAYVLWVWHSSFPAGPRAQPRPPHSLLCRSGPYRMSVTKHSSCGWHGGHPMQSMKNHLTQKDLCNWFHGQSGVDMVSELETSLRSGGS